MMLQNKEQEKKENSKCQVMNVLKYKKAPLKSWTEKKLIFDQQQQQQRFFKSPKKQLCKWSVKFFFSLS